MDKDKIQIEIEERVKKTELKNIMKACKEKLYKDAAKKVKK